MIDSPAKQGENRADAALAPVLEWRVHLARRQPRRTLFVAAAVVLGSMLAGLACSSLVWAVIGALLLSLACAEFFFPIHYRLSADGIRSRNLLSWRRMAWDRVRICYLDQHGIKVSPLRHRSRLETYRGIYLWFGDGNREQVTAAVRHWRAQERTA